MSKTRRTTLACLVAASLAPAIAGAVYLDADGRGQALIYPYYTTRTVSGNEFNTYLSVVNHTPQAKVVRVAFREARNSRVVRSFNLYLAPNDAWAAALVPVAVVAPSNATTDTGTRILTTDVSCTNPRFEDSGGGPPILSFTSESYIGANADSFGNELDRVREGWIEMLEMATLTGDSAAAVTPPLGGVAPNCAAVLGTPALTVAAPTGGLSGTVTYINVANGQDFSVNAEALAQLTTAPFYRPPNDPYPGFDASEVTPVSTFTANGSAYRSVWSRGVDAVSAVLMRSEAIAEYVLDGATRSRTELVATFPTRSYYGSGGATQAPFAERTLPTAIFFNRETFGAITPGCDFPVQPTSCQVSYRPATNLVVTNGRGHLSVEGVFGSGGTRIPVVIVNSFDNGVLTLPLATPQRTLASLPASTRIDLATGAITTGIHVYSGMPVVGFAARTFENGTLGCAGGFCQGNYGSAFPFKYRRAVTAP